jgi:integrase
MIFRKSIGNGTYPEEDNRFCSLEQIMDRLDHTDDQITKNVYLHVTQEMKKEASHKFGQLMRSLR